MDRRMREYPGKEEEVNRGGGGAKTAFLQKDFCRFLWNISGLNLGLWSQLLCYSRAEESL